MKKLMMISAVVAMAAVVSGGAVNANSEKKVKTTGIENFEPNAIFLSNLRFAPGDTKVKQGDIVTWVDNDRPDVPHTIDVIGNNL